MPSSTPASPRTAPLRGADAIDYVAASHPYTWDEMLAFPKFIDIETINMCNARCTMCGIDFDHRRRQRMTDSLFDRITSELGDHRDHVERVSLVLNSEPLLDRELATKIAKLKRAGLRRTFITTNASLLSPRRATELLEAGLDVIYVSLDSLDPKRFEAIRRGLSFEQVYRNIRDLIRLKRQLRPDGTVRVSMVQLRENQDEAQAFLHHWAELLGPNDQVVVTRGYNWGLAQHVVASAGTTESFNRVPCVGLWTSFAIDVSGLVRMCCTDQAGVTCLGDVNRDSIARIWQDREMQRIRETHIAGRRASIALCDGCPVWAREKHLLRVDLPSPLASSPATLSPSALPSRQS